MTRILVLGAGVIGSVYALRFAKAGYSVDILARGARLAAIRGEGLVLRHAAIGIEERAEVETLDALKAGSDYDLVLVALRSGQIEASLHSLSEARIDGLVLVVGNNLGDLEAQSRIVGLERFVLGFGAFGGYRERGSVVYIDGRTKEKPAFERLNGTTIGVLSDSARPALERARTIFHDAALPVKESTGISAWLVCHAALVFPLAGAIYAAAGDQARLCRTRDAIVLGVRAAKELLRALRTRGIGLEPGYVRKLMIIPEWILVRMLSRSLAGEGARVGMFGHANAPGGREEIGGQASVLDARARGAGMPMPAWDSLLPYFAERGALEPVRDGARSLRPRLLK
jgi:2-dehydropantoate 2-reductase